MREGTEGRTSGDHQVRAVDELGDDGRGRGEEGEEVGAFPERVYFGKVSMLGNSALLVLLTCWYQSTRILPNREPKWISLHGEVYYLSHVPVVTLPIISANSTHPWIIRICRKLLVV